MQRRAVHKNGKKRITTARRHGLVLQWRDEQQQQRQKPTGRLGEQVLGIEQGEWVGTKLDLRGNGKQTRGRFRQGRQKRRRRIKLMKR